MSGNNLRDKLRVTEVSECYVGYHSRRPVAMVKATHQGHESVVFMELFEAPRVGDHIRITVELPKHVTLQAPA